MLFAGLLSCALLHAAEVRITPPDASRPATVRATVHNGAINVSGYDGKDILVDSRGAFSWDPEGDNGIRLRVNPNSSLQLRVPYATSLRLEGSNGGGIRIDHVRGEMELSHLNGGIYATNVSGSMVAHSTNGRIQVTFDQIAAGKPMSFTTMNGSVDVTLPADTKAMLHMRTNNGSIDCDFDMRLAPGTYGRGRETTASINGGGPEFNFRSVNGSIRIHKKR